MTIDLLTAPREGLLGKPPNGLKLRLTRRGHHGRIVNVRGSKCTIGASANCNLRIDGPKVDPLACLLLRGVERTLVRGYSSKVQLNGQHFGDALLKPGDQLQVGSYEIEILPNDVDLGQELTRTREDIAHLRNGLVDIQRLLNDERAEFEQRDEQWRARLAASELEAGKHAETLAALFHLQAEFAAAQRLLADERAAFHEREEQLKAHFVERLAQHERDAAQHAEALVTLRQLQIDFAATERLLAEERSTWDGQRQQLEARLAVQEARAAKNAETAEALKRVQSDLAALEALRAKEREESQTQQTQFRERLIDNELELAAARQQFDAQKLENDSIVAALASAKAEAGRLQAEFEAVQQALAKERATFQEREEHSRARLADGEEVAAKYTQTLDTLAGLEAELADVRRDYEEQRAIWKRGREEAEFQLLEQLAEREQEAAQNAETLAALTQLQADLAATERLLANERSAWESERQQLEARLAEQDVATREVARLEHQLSAAQADGERERADAEARQNEFSAQLAETNARLVEANHQVEELRHAVNLAQRELEEERTAFRQREDDLQARLAEWLVYLHSAQNAAAQHTQTTETLTRVQSELAAIEADRARERADAGSRREELDSRLAEKERRLAEASREVDRLRQTLREAHGTLEKERAAWQQREAEWQSRLADDEAAAKKNAELLERLEKLQADFAAADRARANEQTEWNSQREQFIARLNERESAVADLTETAHEIARLRDALGESQREVDELRTSLAAPPASADSGQLSHDDPPSCQPEEAGRLLDRISHDDQAKVAFETPSASAPVSTASLLNQFGFSVDEDHIQVARPASRTLEECGGLVEGDRSDVEALKRQGSPDPSSQGDSLDSDSPATEYASDADMTSSPDDVEVIDDQRPTRTQASDDDEESIDDYMNQLMARLGKPSYTPPPSEDEVSGGGIASPAKQHSRKTDAATAAVRKLRDTSEMVRRSQAPERSSDLSALREVANLNARTALDTHNRSTLSRPWLTKAIVALVALLSAVVNGWIGLDGNAVAVYLAIVSLGAAGYFGSMCLTTARSIVATRGQAGSPAEDAAKP